MAKVRKTQKPDREGSVVAAPKGSIVVRSAESSRMTGMRSIPTERRDAAIRAFLKTAR